MDQVAERPNTRRCPRCETTKPRDEFTTQGLCRPCSRAYERERYAKKRAERGDAPPTPRAPTPALEALRGGVPLAEVMREMEADPTIAAHLAEARTGGPRPALIREKPPEPVAASRRLRVTRALGESLALVLEDGERLTLSAIRVGSCIVVEGLDVCEVET